jgi:4-hydroxythreonine-4-phosphate dehydrogenase
LRVAICAIFVAKRRSLPRNKVVARRPIVVSMGDPCGIGPEVTAKAWQALRTSNSLFAVLGDAPLYCGIPVAEIESLEQASAVFADALPVLRGFTTDGALAGKPDPRFAPAILGAIEQGVTLVKSGKANALVTAPIAKSVLMAAGFSYPGHTEYLGALLANAPLKGPRGPIMMLAVDGLRVVPVTIHCALNEVATRLTTESIVQAAKVTAQALVCDFRIPLPRIVIAALNPHAGEDGAFGDEEARIIVPAIEQLKAQGLDVSGPYPADSLFHAEARRKYDAVICMYHDQALIPLKTLDFWGGVNITLGLPIIRTSPDHGTGFDIAGQGKANPDSMIAAIKMAATMAENRSSS